MNSLMKSPPWPEWVVETGDWSGLKVKRSKVMQEHWWGLTRHLGAKQAALHNLPFASVWGWEPGELWSWREWKGEKWRMNTSHTVDRNRVLSIANLVLGFEVPRKGAEPRAQGSRWAGSTVATRVSVTYSANVGNVPPGEVRSQNGGPRH